MNRLPSQQQLLTLHNKLDKESYKGKAYEVEGIEQECTECAKSVKSAESLFIPASLLAVYVKVSRQHDYLYRQADDQGKLQRGYSRLMKTLAREYLPALASFQESYPREALVAERDTLIDRLNRGMDMQPAPDGDEATDRIAELFDRLLIRYSVVHDAVEGNVIMRHTHGLDEWVGA